MINPMLARRKSFPIVSRRTYQKIDRLRKQWPKFWPAKLLVKFVLDSNPTYPEISPIVKSTAAVPYFTVTVNAETSPSHLPTLRPCPSLAYYTNPSAAAAAAAIALTVLPRPQISIIEVCRLRI
jgi:hypothetical protein